MAMYLGQINDWSNSDRLFANYKPFRLMKIEILREILFESIILQNLRLALVCKLLINTGIQARSW